MQALGWGSSSVAFLMAEGLDGRITKNGVVDSVGIPEYSGVPDYCFGDEFKDRLGQDFHRHDRINQIDPEEPNMVIDFRPFDDVELEDDLYRELEIWFDNNGIDVACLEYKESIDSSGLEKRNDSSEILKSGDFTGKVLSQEPYFSIGKDYRDMAVQVFLAPWKLIGPDENKTYGGMAYGTRSIVNISDQTQYDLFTVTAHEVLHCTGLRHSEKSGNLMNPGEEDYKGLNEIQWRKVRKQLS